MSKIINDLHSINDFLNICEVLERALSGKIKHVVADEVIYQKLKRDQSGEFARCLSSDLATFYTFTNWACKTGRLNPELSYIIEEDTISIYITNNK